MTLSTHYREVLNALGFHGRPFIDKVVEKMSEEWSDVNIFIVDAPTGYGKTALSMSIAKYSIEEEFKAVIAYPLRALLEDQLRKFKEVFEALKVREKLGVDGEVVEARYMNYFNSKYLVKPVTLTTVDMLSMMVAGVPPEDLSKVSKALTSWTSRESLGHYIFSWASSLSSNIVVDEVHLLGESGKGLGFIRFLAEAAVEFGTHLVLMSATVTDALLERSLPPDVRGGKKVKVFKFTEHVRQAGINDPFIRGRVQKRYSMTYLPIKEGEERKLIDWVAKKISDVGLNNAKVLMVFNTVKEAVRTFKLISEHPAVTHLQHFLIHSKLTGKDKEMVSCRLTSLQNAGGGYVVVATQSVEAGVDITSNILVTDISAPTALVQRFGRFLRREDEVEGEALIWWTADVNGNPRKSGCPKDPLYKVYRFEEVKSLLEFLRNARDINLHLPELPEVVKGVGYLEAFQSVECGMKEVPLNLHHHLSDILMDFDSGSRRAAELLRDLGGSFIRDASLTSVVPENLLTDNIREVLKECAVPVSAIELCRMLTEGKIKEAIMSDHRIVELKSLQMFNELLGACRRIRLCDQVSVVWAARKLTEFQTLNGVEAFITSARYVEGVGLEFL
ncbi:MAG: CRISPR-associated helicase Cas3' [Desulfurococcales archaeon]|nr:CRISPR-associated helicase Cas3' [Desulfurococcales archaeon]